MLPLKAIVRTDANYWFLLVVYNFFSAWRWFNLSDRVNRSQALMEAYDSSDPVEVSTR